MNTAVLLSHQPDVFVVTTTSLPDIATTEEGGTSEETATIAAPEEQPKEVQKQQGPTEEAHVQTTNEEKPQAARFVFDTMFSAFSDRVSTEQTKEDSVVMDPVGLSSRIAKYGKQVLESEHENEDRRRMARRLAEVTPEMFQHRPEHHHLPFGCPKNRCLMRAYDEGAVSPGCFTALQALKEAEVVDRRRVVAAHQAAVARQESETFLAFALIYAVLAVATIYMLHRRFRKFRETMHANRRLRRRVIQAVYSNPAIKRAIEEDIQEDIGFAPPLSPHVLARRSVHGSGFMACRFMKGFMFVCVLLLICVNPLLAMPLLCIFMLMRCCHLTCCAADVPLDTGCSCCCCGASTDAVAKGELSKSQDAALAAREQVSARLLVLIAAVTALAPAAMMDAIVAPEGLHLER
eukprot:CAMPEP_0116579900 /NCGR_PEP_ID=MMETSP0397-20121206/22492_1 /TAXON_ID=216820 /ORGANISM="Cyclophora tenuis, Strain ECT3854" /LENGTH=405 /DNA_ID=CAMNT_0004109399 /DNA_START=1 /DNA_END=1220 /DNA_ORIENTATION=+